MRGSVLISDCAMSRAVPCALRDPLRPLRLKALTAKGAKKPQSPRRKLQVKLGLHLMRSSGLGSLITCAAGPDYSPDFADYQSDIYTRRSPRYHPIVVWQFWGRAARRPELQSSGRFFISGFRADLTFLQSDSQRQGAGKACFKVEQSDPFRGDGVAHHALDHGS